jgi:integral membrane sensor domain MASE1
MVLLIFGKWLLTNYIRFVKQSYPLSRRLNKEFLLRCLRIFIWGLAYYLVAWFSLEYLLDANGAAIAWPPEGIFISAILLTPAKQRPYLIAVIFVAEVIADFPLNEANNRIAQSALIQNGC